MTSAGKDYGVRVIRPFLQFSPGFVMPPVADGGPNALYREKLVKGRWVEELTAPVGAEKSREEKPKLTLPKRNKSPLGI